MTEISVSGGKAVGFYYFEAESEQHRRCIGIDKKFF